MPAAPFALSFPFDIMEARVVFGVMWIYVEVMHMLLVCQGAYVKLCYTRDWVLYKFAFGWQDVGFVQMLHDI